MSDHTHSQYVEGCYRCDLSRDEVASGYITDAMVEQAALADLNHWRGEWNALAPLTGLGDVPNADEWRHGARIALEAVVPDIIRQAKAEALREAAQKYQWGGWAERNPTIHVDLATRRRQTEHAVKWLRDRADQIAGGQQ